MLFIDYTFDLLPGGSIRFDKDLSPSDINVKDGDEFVLAVIDERVVFLKKDS
jgi:hypothetical protein